MSSSDLYRDAGVDIAAGNEAAKRYAKLVAGTMTDSGTILRDGTGTKIAPGGSMIGALGGFAGGFQLDLARYPEPVLFSGTDGVGTKLKLAFAMGRHNTVGIDCVAMCVNDVLTSGAQPLVFLDYLATGKLDVDTAEQVVSGVAVGCQQAACTLVGGETAEMPGMYAEGEYDMAGFTVGVANKSAIIDGSGIQEGDVVIGLASNGVHSNGFSLIRKVVEDAGLDWSDPLPFLGSPANIGDEAGQPTTLGEELLTPTRIYVRPILHLLQDTPVQGMAHITGGGLVENIPRVLPAGLGVNLQPTSWTAPPVFGWLEAQTGMSFAECARVWNMGIGYVVIVRQSDADQALNRLHSAGETAMVIGQVVAGDGVRFEA